MKKKYFIFLFIIMGLLPFKVFAIDGFNLSNSNINLYIDETKKITISSDVAVGKLNISSSNNAIASVNVSSVFIQNIGSSQDIEITGKTIGTTTVTVVATAEFATMEEEILEGETKTITVNVIEKPKETLITPPTPTPPSTSTVNTPTAQKNNDATLKNIELSNGTIEFSNDKDTYDVSVGYDVSSIEVKGILNDNKASVKLEGDTNLKEGENIIKLIVTAEDGIITKTYTLNVKRENKILSKNNNIKKLTINNYDINFNKNKKEYDLIINNEDNLTINVELEDKFAKYDILGNKRLKNKSVIKIKVTAEDNSVKEYKINIIKEVNKTKELKIALLVSIVLNTIIMGLLLFVVLRLNKYNKNILKEVFMFKKY